jgi:hypothetical protein
LIVNNPSDLPEPSRLDHVNLYQGNDHHQIWLRM